MEWPTFSTPAARCDACGLFKTSLIQALPGSGNPSALLALVGEAPGEGEEEYGQNFVGRAGQMLDSCIQEARLLRSNIWICNSVRCRPTKVVEEERRNRTPTPHELTHCNGYLTDELLQIKPRAILCLGDIAAKAVLHTPPPGGVTENLGKVIWSDRFNCWVILTYHPSYLLRRQSERQMLVFALMKAAKYADGTIGQPAPVDYRVIESLDEAIYLKEKILREATEIAFDWETNGIHLTKSIGFALGLSWKEREAYVIPRYASRMLPRWTHEDFHRLDQEVIIPILMSDIPKGGSNVPFDMSISETTLGVIPRNVTFDCAVAQHMVNNHLGLRARNLKLMADMYTDMGRYDDELDNWLVANGYTKEGKPDMEYLCMAPDELVHKYLCADADATLRVKHVLEPRLKEEGVWDIYVNEILPFALEHRELDRIGVRVNIPYAHEVSGEFQHALDQTEAEVSAVAGHAVNPNSYPQVGKLLFDELGLPIIGRTESGAPSTKEEDLIQIKDLNTAVQLILEYRAYLKLKGYVDGKRGNRGILAVVDEDGYARMSTFIPGTETLRLITRKPFPIHTWPKTSPGKPSVRKLIIPDPGFVIVSSDYKQQEWAIQAIAAGQHDMVEAILDRGEDIHEMVMKDLGHIAKTQFQNTDGTWINDDEHHRYAQLRSKFKAINFKILFRGGATSLAKSINESEEAAAQYISDYYERYDKIKWWQYERIKELRNTGRVRGLFTTYRIIPGIYDANKYTKLESERQGCNFPIQNAGAHVLYRSTLGVIREFRRLNFPARVLFTQHDNIVSQVRRDLVEEGTVIVRRIMEQSFPELAGRSIKTDITTGEWWE